MILLALALCSFTGQNVLTIPTPVSYTDPSSSTWQQSFQVVLGSASPTTAVFVIPGGPGDTTISPRLPVKYLGIPSSWNTVLTDPRGAGCNVGPPASTFSTDTLARDILTIIKTVHVTDYIIYGISYGTVEATVLENLIEADPSVPRPRAVVLEGCFGHAWNGYEDYLQGSVAEWDRVKMSVLQPATVALFATPPYPLGFSSSDWALLIMAELGAGDTPGVGHALHLLLEPINETEIRRLMPLVQLVPALEKILILPITCSELSGSWRSADLVSNELVSAGAEQCTSGFTNRYDSAAFPTTVPLYHFQGQFDPIVRTTQSMYHYLSHSASRSAYVVIANAGHAPFARSLMAMGCTESIWTAMASGTPLGPSLDACGLPYALVEGGQNQPLLPPTAP